MHILWNILRSTRRIEHPLVKTYPSANSQRFYKPLLLCTNSGSIMIWDTFRRKVKRRSFSVMSCHCCYYSQDNWPKYFCTVAENRKDEPNKIISLLESRRFEKENKLDIKSFLDSVCAIQELSVVEWDSLKEQLLKLSNIFNAVNFSGHIMKILLLKGNHSLAHSFMEYLKANGKQPNVFTLSTFMKLCSENSEKCKEQDIVDAYNGIKHSEIMNAVIMENVICALSLTSQWEEGYKLYKEAGSNVPKSALSSLASAAFNHHSFEIALTLVAEIEKLDSFDWNDLHVAWLNAISSIHAKSPQKAMFLLDKLILQLRAKEIILSKDAAMLISHYFESLKNEDWKATFVKFSRKRSCPNCGQPLQLLEISPEEHETLKQAIFTKIVKGSDVFLNTTPDELRKFKNFVKSTAPYDIVIDGLNVAYYYLHDTSNSLRAHQLYLVVNHFAKVKGMKTLVLGRKHMTKWPRKYMNLLSQIAEVFYAENLSKDDPFLLYAALMSGPHTRILTKDLLRNHKFWLEDPSLGTCFERWRRSRQVFLNMVKSSGSVICEEPLPYSIIIQGSMEEGWHIPCKLTEDDNLKSVYDFHKDWLCIRRKS